MKTQSHPVQLGIKIQTDLALFRPIKVRNSDLIMLAAPSLAAAARVLRQPVIRGFEVNEVQ
jgi:hypothetical protein